MDTPKFWWFDRPSAVTLARQLIAALLTGTFVRLEAIPYDKDGTPALKFRVVTTASGTATQRDGDGDINDSRPCPPICPD